MGDSGSPLMVTSTSHDGKTRYSLAGSVYAGSRGGCGNAGNYAMAYETVRYRNWYRDILEDNGSGDKVQWCDK